MNLPPPPPLPAAVVDDSSDSDDTASSSLRSTPSSTPRTPQSARVAPSMPPPSLPLPGLPPSSPRSHRPSLPPPPMPTNLPPPPKPSTSLPTATLPPPPASSDVASSPRSDKKADKLDKKAAEKAEKERKKAEKAAKKDEKKSKEKEKKSKDKSKDKDSKDKKKDAAAPSTISAKDSSSSLSTPSDSSSEPMTKEERKKQEEEAEELSFSATFDKGSFLFNRVKNFPCIDQLEGKFRMKTASWHDRYLVLYCDFILYYECKGSQPRDFDKPLGALPLERVIYKKVKDFEERMDVSGLIPKTIMYDFCFEVPIASADGKERLVLLQFDREEAQKNWREKIKSQAKNIDAVKAKVTPELKNTIEVLANKFPISNRLKEAPYPGDEEKWIKNLKDHYAARSKHRTDLRRAQLFSDFYLPNYKAYIDWFVTSGGEAGIASLEKELMLAEDSVVAAWKTEFSSGMNAFENEIDTLEKDNEQACRFLLGKVQRKLHLLKMHVLFNKEIYPSRPTETFDEENANWKAFESLLQGYIDTILKSRMDEHQRSMAEAEEAARQAEIDRARREEERRNDPFGAGDDDDPFADTKIVGV